MSLNPNSTGNVLFAIQNNSINCSIARQDKQCCYFLSNHEVAMDATHPAGDHHTSSGRARFTIEEMIAEGDKVVVRWTARGTHQGAFRGIPPTGKQVTITGVEIHRVVGGKIVEGWRKWDRMDVMQQLGVTDIALYRAD